MRSIDFARDDRPKLGLLNDSHSNLPKSAESVDCILAVCPVADCARTDAHANACVQSERFRRKRRQLSPRLRRKSWRALLCSIFRRHADRSRTATECRWRKTGSVTIWS